jgi:hypothetical protein
VTFLRASLIGGLTVLVIEVALAFLLNVIGTSQHWGSGQLGIGPLVIYTFSRTGASFAVQSGPGVLAVAVAIGLLNGLGAQWLSRTSER